MRARVNAQAAANDRLGAHVNLGRVKVRVARLADALEQRHGRDVLHSLAVERRDTHCARAQPASQLTNHPSSPSAKQPTSQPAASQPSQPSVLPRCHVTACRPASTTHALAYVLHPKPSLLTVSGPTLAAVAPASAAILRRRRGATFAQPTTHQPTSTSLLLPEESPRPPRRDPLAMRRPAPTASRSTPAHQDGKHFEVFVRNLPFHRLSTRGARPALQKQERPHRGPLQRTAAIATTKGRTFHFRLRLSFNIRLTFDLLSTYFRLTFDLLSTYSRLTSDLLSTFFRLTFDLLPTFFDLLSTYFSLGPLVAESTRT